MQKIGKLNATIHNCFWKEIKTMRAPAGTNAYRLAITDEHDILMEHIHDVVLNGDEQIKVFALTPEEEINLDELFKELGVEEIE